MVKRVLMVAFHYPPVKGSSGVLRSLKFSNYLRDFGWHPDVLTVRPFAYVQTGDDQLADIPSDVRVTRSLAFDAKRHLGLFGVYPAFAGVPDRWASWRFDGVRRGMQLIREIRPDVIWSTFPISTAHRIALTLARKSGIPWVADCRDSMSEPGYPRDPRVFAAVRSLEEQVVSHASAVTFTAPSAVRMYAERYPQIDPGRWRLIQNGFDETSFDGLSARDEARAPDAPITLVHAGILYPTERNPLPFFRALATLKQRDAFGPRGIRVVLRATGHDDRYRSVLEELDIADIVELAPGVPYRDALQEMLTADALLLFQSRGCNHQIPAKTYEYLRAGRPIFSMTDRAGDTAALLQENRQDFICPLDDQQQITDALPRFLAQLNSAEGIGLGSEAAARYSRRAQAGELAALLNELATVR